MRILLITPSYFPIVGGSEVLTRNLSTALDEMGVHSDIMTLNMNKKWNPIWKEEILKNDSTKVFREPALNILPDLPNPLFNLFRMNIVPKPSFVRRFKDYDIIHFIGEADLGFPILSCFVKKPKLLQCVAIFRNGGLYKYYMYDRPFLGRIFRRYFPRLADVFVISSNEEKELLLDLGVHNDKVLILPIGVDTRSFHPDETKRIDNLLVFVGRIDRIKGLHILLEALSFLESPVQLAIIGARWDAKYAKEIEEMASAINENRVHRVVLLGSMDQSDLVPWYQKASVLVCPYLYETYSNVIRESLACGTPVISTGSHLIKGGTDGVLLISRDPRDLGGAINKLLRDKQTRKRLGNDGRKIIEQYFSWESVVKNLVEIYEDMLNQ